MQNSENRPKLDSSLVKRALRGKSVPSKNIPDNNDEPESDEGLKSKNVLSQFSKDVRSSPGPPKEPLQPILNVYRELDDVVSNLDSKIVDMVKKQSGDFVHAHMIEMMKRRRELQDAKNKYEESLAKINKDAKIKALEKELQFFRDEAIQLAKLLEGAKSFIKDLKGQVRTLQDEKEFLTNYIRYKQTKLTTTKTEQQLEEPNQANRVIKRPVSGHATPDKRSFREKSPDISALKERRVSSPPLEMATIAEVDVECLTLGPNENKTEAFLTSLEGKSLKDKSSSERKGVEAHQMIVASYEKQLQDLKKALLKEKMKVEELMKYKAGEMNNFLEFFTNCVSNVRKSVAKRKIMVKTGANSRKNMNKTNGWSIVEDVSVVNLDDFSVNDQQKVLETFVSHPQVTEAIKNIIFQTKKIHDNSGIFDEKLIKQKYTSFISDNSTLNFASGEKTDAGTSFDTNVSFDQKPPRPKTAGLNPIELRDLPEIAESEMEASKRKDFLLLDPRVVDMKFAQLNESKDAPVFRPQGRTRMRKLSQNYQNYQA